MKEMGSNYLQNQNILIIRLVFLVFIYLFYINQSSSLIWDNFSSW